MPKKKPKPRPQKKRRLCTTTVAAAKLVASGMSQTKVAAQLGVSQPTVSRAVATVEGLITNLDDVVEARRQSIIQLNETRKRLLEIAGMRDHLDPDARIPPAKPRATADRLVTPEQWDDYKRQCLAEGFDINGFPITSAEPAQQVSACRGIVQIEQRKARLLGLDAPKLIASVTAKSVMHMTDEELAAEMREAGLEPPPGLMELLDAGKNPHPVVSAEAQGRGLRPLAGGAAAGTVAPLGPP